MKKSGKLILKVKKRDSSAAAKKLKEHPTTSKDLCVPGQKRCNPFSQTTSSKRVSDSVCNEKVDLSESKLLWKLDSIKGENQTSKPLNDVGTAKRDLTGERPKEDYISKVDARNEEEQQENEERKETTYCSPLFPLDWSIKQRVKLISTKPLSFCNAVKAADKASGIKKFITEDNESPSYCQFLYSWVYPLIPGIQNFPLKKTLLAAPVKEGVAVNFNRSFQEALLQQWKISFQSLFNMLKTRNCTYFYVCGHQFSILFKACGVGSDQMRAVLTPTTKGLRSMLTEEGILFEFTHQNEMSVSSTSDDAVSNEDHNCSTLDSETCIDADLFLDSLGLNKNQHFPKIEEQRKLSEKSKLRLLDNRPESTIEIQNCQSFFNFLLNFPFLCAPSGRMMGIPPTLISPDPFEGGSLYINKYTYGKVKNKVSSSLDVHCLEISGFVLPTQLKGIIDLQLKTNPQNFFIQAKGYGGTFGFNSMNNVHFEGDHNQFLNQIPAAISDQYQVHYSDQLFKF